MDALVGYSLDRPAAGILARLIDWANASRRPILSLDIPSGIDADSGVTRGTSVRPTVTLTLALPKTGLSHARVGLLYLGDIGIPASIYARIGITYENPFRESFIVPLNRHRR